MSENHFVLIKQWNNENQPNSAPSIAILLSFESLSNARKQLQILRFERVSFFLA